MGKTAEMQMKLLRLMDRYNGDWDLAEGDPLVTYTDEQLIEVLRTLIDEVEHLQNMIALLQAERGEDNGYE